VTIAILLPLLYLFQTGAFSFLSFDKDVYTDLSTNGFGELLSDEESFAEASRSILEEEATGFGGGGVMSDAKEIAPYPYISKAYAYHYEGSYPLSDLSNKVYRQVTEDLSLYSLEAQIKKTTIGNFSFSYLDQPKIQNIMVSEDKENGYSLQVDALYGTVYLTRNWQSWDESDVHEAMTLDQIPANEEIIMVAQTFLQEYGIDISSYGNPVVQDEWFNFASGVDGYIPEIIGVVYPRVIEGVEVWDLYGSPTGLLVYVNVRTGTIDSANWSIGHSFERSSYDLVSELDEVSSLIEQGGLYQYQYEFADVTYDITLSEPTFVLAQYTQYKGNEFSTLYLPALAFPISEKPEGAEIFSDHVVVPLVKEFLSESGNDRYPILLEEGVREVDVPVISP